MNSITSLPYTINQPGQYQLNASAYLATTAITIKCNDVYLDLNNNYIVRNSNANNTDKGIYIYPNLTGITIKNGFLRGFFYGIHYDDSTYSRSIDISNMNIQDCTFRGIVATGGYNHISNCTIRGIQGTKFFMNPFAAGIEVTGPALIENNNISEVYGAGIGEGLHISSSDQGYNTIIRNNLLTNKNKTTHNYCIWIGGASKAYVMNNTIIGADFGLTYSSPTSGGHKDNLYIDCTTGLYNNSSSTVGL